MTAPLPRRRFPILLVAFALLVPAALAAPARTVRHVVRRGETLAAIGRQYGVAVQAIVRANRITRPDRIAAGRVLRIPSDPPPSAAPAIQRDPAADGPDEAPAPPPAGSRHVVRRGETLSSIGRHYGVTVQEIVRANGIARPGRIAAGKVLRIPGGTPQPASFVVERRVEPPPGEAPPGDLPIEPPAPAPAVAPADEQWMWPVAARVSSDFGHRHRRFHAGIDIPVPLGTAVVASRSGTVAFSGRRGGYGQIVVIDHGDGTSSYYAHLARIGVQHGTTVLQGQTIGAAGRTGRASSAHVHFEVRIDGAPVDPQVWLPDAARSE